MSQSATVVGLLALAFVLYVAARGRLTAYTGVLWGSKATATGATKSSSSGASDVLSTAKDLAQVAALVAEVA